MQLLLDYSCNVPFYRLVPPRCTFRSKIVWWVHGFQECCLKEFEIWYLMFAKLKYSFYQCNFCGWLFFLFRIFYFQLQRPHLCAADWNRKKKYSILVSQLKPLRKPLRKSKYGHQLWDCLTNNQCISVKRVLWVY